MRKLFKITSIVIIPLFLILLTIFSANVIVKSAPSSNSTDLFSLHAGTKLKITDNIQKSWDSIK